MVQSLKSNKFLELTIGLILVAYSNVLSFLITALFLIIFYGINYKATLHVYKNILKLILIIFTITSFIWIPVITLTFNNKINTPTPIKLVGLDNHILLKSFFGDINERGLGTFPILAIFMFLLCIHKCNKSVKQFYWISLITVLICSKLFPWTLLPRIISNLLSHVQFVFRFLMIPILLLNYVFSYTTIKLIQNKKYKYILTFILILGTIGLHVSIQQYKINKSRNLPNLSTNTNVPISTLDNRYKLNNSKQINNITNNGITSITDYFPQKSLCKYKYITLQNRNKNSSKRYIYIKHIGFNKYSFKNKANNNLVLPLVCYKSEHLNINLDHHPVSYHSNKYHLITVNHVNKGYHQFNIEPKKNIKINILKLLFIIIGIIGIVSL